jgi:indolepyruvate decarboxylase
MKATDCPIALGTIITDDYRDIMKSSFGQMIEVNDSETRVGYSYYHQVAMKDFLEALLAKFQAEPGPRTCELPHVSPRPPITSQPGDPLTYNVFFRELADFLKSQGLFGKVTLVLGESTSLYVFGNLFGLPPNSFVGQAAWGSLGHETGCALGIALATGTRPYVVAGDGGFRMICQELSSLAARKCNAVVFVMSNDAYAIEQAFVDINAFKPDGEFAPFDLLPAWDYPALAQAFGARGYRVRTAGELADVLTELQGVNDAPALVEVVIPQKDLAPQLARLAAVPPQTSKYHKTRTAPGSQSER